MYPRNFTKTVVCELRIPTLVEIDVAEMKVVAHALRKRFALKATVNEIEVGPGATSDKTVNQQYGTRDSGTAVVLQPCCYCDRVNALRLLCSISGRSRTSDEGHSEDDRQ